MIFDKKTFWILLLAFPLFLCMSPENADHGSNSLDFVGKSINFIVLFGGLFFILRKPIKNYLEEKRRKEDLSIKEAMEARNKSEKKLNSALKSLDKLSEKVRKIKEEAEKNGEEQKEKIIESARQEAENLKEMSKQEIDAIYASGIKELRSYAADVTIKEASKRIKQKMTPKLRSVIIDKSIERLDKLHENSDSR